MIRIAFVIVFLVFCSIDFASAGDAPTAQWIWGTEQANQKAQAGRCEFRSQFSLSEPKHGELAITCDNQYVVRLNGRLVGMGDNCQQLDRYDVSEILRDGENTIYVRCRNTDNGPAGLLARLTVDSDRGSQRVVSSDRWQAKVQLAGTWDPSVIRRTPWGRAHVIGVVGKTAPWGVVKDSDRVQVVRASVPFEAGPLKLESGDRVLLLGSTLIERAQKYGLIEHALTTRFPKSDVIFRNLGWSGDTVFGHARARFGTVADGFDHLETHVFAEQPSLILVGYGTNESFAGEAGLDDFVAGMNTLIDTLSATGARIVLLSPLRQENLGPPLPDPSEQNRRLELYRNAIAEVAQDRQCGFIDLYELVKSDTDAQLTDNGMHLTSFGYEVAARAFEQGFSLPARQWRLTANWGDKSVASKGPSVTRVEGDDQQLQFQVVDAVVPLPQSRVDTSARRTLQVTDLPQGQYQLSVDDMVVATGDQDQWQQGLAIETGPELDQANQLRDAINKKNQLYFYRWRPQNETYLFLFRKHEQGNNAVEIPQFDPLIESQEQEIARLRVPQAHQYRFSRVK